MCKRKLIGPRGIRKVLLHGPRDDLVVQGKECNLASREGAGLARDGLALARINGGKRALDERVKQYVDVFSFLFHHLGVDYRYPEAQ